MIRQLPLVPFRWRSISTSPGLCKHQSCQDRAKDVLQLAVLRIEWAPDGFAATLQHMRIDHGSAHIFMPQEFLHGTDVVAIFQQMRREAMTLMSLATLSA
jgi:hypothetical protein